MSSIFGPLVTCNDVAEAVKASLKTWLPTELAQAERESDRDPGVLQMPRSWTKVATFHQYTDQQLPACLIQVASMENPHRHGDGSITAQFPVVVGVLVKGQDPDNAFELANLYAGAVTRALLQGDPSLGGLASAIDLEGAANDEVPADYMPVGWFTGIAFRVTADGVVTVFGGPAEPDLDPDDLPIVETVVLAVERITS